MSSGLALSFHGSEFQNLDLVLGQHFAQLVRAARLSRLDILRAATQDPPEFSPAEGPIVVGRVIGVALGSLEIVLKLCCWRGDRS